MQPGVSLAEKTRALSHFDALVHASWVVISPSQSMDEQPGEFPRVIRDADHRGVDRLVALGRRVEGALAPSDAIGAGAARGQQRLADLHTDGRVDPLPVEGDDEVTPPAPPVLAALPSTTTLPPQAAVPTSVEPRRTREKKRIRRAYHGEAPIPPPRSLGLKGPRRAP